jgi:virulence factor Mce-like protein
MRRPSTGSIAGSPVLVGAVTVLITVTAVFLAYNANQGLPFVPTFNVSAQIPGGANLVVGNDVRVGGEQVGIVSRIRPALEPGSNRSIAIVDLKLEKEVVPLARDTEVFVRPRSNLGLKYIEMTPGNSPEKLSPGDTIPLAQSKRPIEIDEFFSTFNLKMRNAQKGALMGFGNALAGRGPSINRTIESLVPFVTHLEPVMRNLSDPTTQLGRFFRESRSLAGQIAPVATTYARLFGNMATTFEALGRDEEALQQTIERGPRTLEQGIRSLPPQRPFLSDAEVLFRELRPTAEEFERTLPTVSDALRTGAPVLTRAPALYRRTEDVFAALDETAGNPDTLRALTDLKQTVQAGAPLLTYVAPYETVCNYFNYYFTAFGEHVSEPFRFGTIQRVNLKSDNRTQDNRSSSSEADRPADVPDNVDPQTAEDPEGNPLTVARRTAYYPAVTPDGDADCQVGQAGYLDGPLVTGSPYPPSNDATKGGGSHVVLDSDLPGVAGPTFTGMNNLREVK